VPKLAGAAVVAAVRGDAAVVAGSQKQHLVLPGVGAQRAAMTDDHRLATAPVLAVDQDVAGVLFTDIKIIHGKLPFREVLQVIRQ
jgi:hypothetical protein